MIPVGAASTCYPNLSAVDLGQSLRSISATTTDLAAGRGQAWELTDPNGEAVERAGIKISTVGLKVELGDPSLSRDSLMQAARPFIGHRLRMFAAEGSGHGDVRSTVLSQVAVLKDLGFGADDICIDTHQGHATASDIERLAEDLGLPVVADNEGLSFLTKDPSNFLSRIRTHVRVLHLKAFEHVDGRLSTNNIPIRESDLDALVELIATCDPSVDVLLQTRSQTITSDLEFIRRASELAR